MIRQKPINKYDSGGSGSTGISGYSGYSGSTGVDGISGYSGSTGVDGISGYSGYSGSTGVDGISGYSGYSGAGGGGSSAVEARNTGGNIVSADSGKTLTCNSSSAQTFNLPSVGASDVGFEITVVKLGTGKVTIDAADSDLIEDSGEGKTIYCSDDYIASITLKLVTETQWIIKAGASGNWTTTV